MSQDEPGWPLPPETAGYYLRSIEAAEHDPDADFIWAPSPEPQETGKPGPEVLTWDKIMSGEQEPPMRVLKGSAVFLWVGVLADIALVITGVLGSLPWHTVENLGAVIFFSGLALSAAVCWAAIAVMVENGRLPRTVAGFSVRTLTGLAALLAGREGPALYGESDDHLRGESGHDPLSWAKVSEAAKWVIAAVRYRGQDWADAAWKPVEAVLRSRFLSGLFVSVPTIVVAVEVLIHKGTMTLFTSFGSIFATGTFLSGVIKAGRWYRNVKPPEPKPRRAGNEDQDT